MSGRQRAGRPGPEALVVSDAVRDLAQHEGGVRREQAIDAVETRDEVHHLSLHTIRVSLYLKRTDTAPPSWVLAQVIPTLRYVEVAWRIYDDMCPGIEEMTPLGVLSAFTDRFGADFLCGEDQTPTRLITVRVVPLSSQAPAEAIRIMGKRPTKWLKVVHAKRDPSANKLHVAVAYALDVSAYSDWLKAH